jgi:cytochrome c-type biogenesis protein CcmH/NrfG
MARGAAQAQRKRRAPEEPKRKKKAAPSWEEQLFFSRLRRHAKVMYVLLAVVFAAGFVVLGVGSGSTGIGDVLQGKLFGGSSNSTSSQIKAKQKAVARSPKDVSLYLDLAGLYQADQKESQALVTLRKAEKVAPKNVDVLNRIALIYSSRAGRTRTTAEDAQILYLSNTTAPPGLDTNSQLGQALASDPYSDALRNKASTAYSKMVTAYTAAETAYRRVVATTKGTSEESSAQLQLASAAQTAGDIPTAVTAYQRFLKIAPDDPNAAAVRQTLTQLKASLPKGQR